MNLIDTLNQIWTQILEVTSIFVMPDWGFLIGLLPVLIVIGLIGPFLTGLVLGTMIYLMRQAAGEGRLRRGSAGRRDRRRAASPSSRSASPTAGAHGLVYEPGTVRCDTDGEPLTVICPMCSLGRLALVDTCTNCGLVLKVKPRARRDPEDDRDRSPAGPRPREALTMAVALVRPSSRSASSSSRSGSRRTSGMP